MPNSSSLGPLSGLMPTSPARLMCYSTLAMVTIGALAHIVYDNDVADLIIRIKSASGI